MTRNQHILTILTLIALYTGLALARVEWVKYPEDSVESGTDQLLTWSSTEKLHYVQVERTKGDETRIIFQNFGDFRETSWFVSGQGKHYTLSLTASDIYGNVSKAVTPEFSIYDEILGIHFTNFILSIFFIIVFAFACVISLLCLVSCCYLAIQYVCVQRNDGH